MANIRIKLLMDDSDLKRFDSSLKNYQQAAGFASERSAFGPRSVGRVSVAQALGITPTSLTQIRSLNTVMDGFNNVFKHTAELAIRTGPKAFDLETIGFKSQAIGNVRQYVDALESVGNAYIDLENTSARARRAFQVLASDQRQAVGTANTSAAARSYRVTARADEARQRLAELADFQRRTGPIYKGGPPREVLSNADEQRYQALQASRARDLGLVRTANAQLHNIEQARLRTIGAITDEYKDLRNVLRSVVGPPVAAAQGAIRSGYAAAQAAAIAPPDIDQNIRQTLESSKELRRVLEKSGLGKGIPLGDLKDSRLGGMFYEQGAKFQTPVRNLVTGVTEVSGAFRDASEKLVAFNAQIDPSGKLITRFGGNLSGVSNIARQVIRDFQKVIEWTVATTVVFATLAATTKQLQEIVELDKNLKRFAITAELSSKESRRFLQELSKVAIATATPLNELVLAADDIALSTRKAGQSTNEWKQDIIALSNAVGILTNLAGISTESATDLLTASIRQLGIETENTVGLLNKITAVAGGQAGSIADIAQGIAALGETGKTAGLNLDQMIATIQVLAQVTSKSPKEVATSLKNLIGSIDAKMSIKALEEFGIAVRDSENNLRPFLDVYKDIQDAIRKGIIPEGRVKEIQKAIAGGPRRAPDAAALLNVVDQVFIAEQRSANASNEALIANAEILDTTAAKMTQLAAAFDTIAYQKFIGIIDKAVELFATLATSGIQLFGGISPKIVETVLALVAFTGAAKFLGVLLPKITGFAGIFIESLIGIQAAAYGATKSMLAFKGATAGAPLTQKAGLLAGVLGNRKTLAVGAGIAGITAIGAINAASEDANANVAELISTVTGLGSVLAAASGAGLPLAATLGVISFAAGQFAESQKRAEKSQLDNSKASIEAFQALLDQRHAIQSLTAQAEKLRYEYDFLAFFNVRTAEQESRLTDIRKELGQITRDLAGANESLVDAQARLVLLLPALGSKYDAVFEKIRLGLATEQEIKQATIELTKAFLEQTGAITDMKAASEGISVFGDIPLGTGTESTRAKPQGGRLGGWYDFVRGYDQLGTFDLSRLLGGGDFTGILDDFFTQMEDGSYRLTASFEATDRNFRLLQEGVERAFGESNTEKANKMIAAIQAFKATIDFSAAIQQFGDLSTAFIASAEATGYYTATQATNARKNQAVLIELEKYIAKVKDPKQRQALTEQVQSALTTTDATVGTQAVTSPVSFNALQPILATLVGMKDVVPTANGDIKILFNSLVALAPAAAAASEDLDGTTLSIQEQEEAAEKAAKSLADFTASSLGLAAQRRAALEERRAAGEFDTAKEKKYYRQQVEQINGIVEATNLWTSTLQANADVQAAIGEDKLPILQQAFSKLAGFEDAATLSGNQLIERLISMGVNMGLTGTQVLGLIQKVIGLAVAIASIPDKQVTIAVQTQVGRLRSAKGTKSGTLYEGRGDQFTGQTIQEAKRIAGQGSSGSNIQSIINNIMKQLARALKTGGLAGGSSAGGGGGGGGGAGRDISTLDLPEEIAQAQNRNALIQQAIKDARRLQRKIPGATREGKNDIVILLDGMNKVLKVRGIKEDLLRRSLDNLAEIEKKRLEFETKADTIRRIRVGTGSFAALANVPINSTTGVSVGSPDNITVNLGITGQILTPAQLDQLANKIASLLKRQIAAG